MAPSFGPDGRFEQPDGKSKLSIAGAARKGSYLTWSNLNVFAKDKQLLNGVSGNAKPGRVLAIMGASGAGKSTLLTSLMGLLGPNYKVRGDVRGKW